jgi:hypothetical protein
VLIVFFEWLPQFSIRLTKIKLDIESWVVGFDRIVENLMMKKVNWRAYG